MRGWQFGLICLLGGACGGRLAWIEHRIDDEALAGVPLRGADGLAVGDVDRDGHLDVVSVHEDSSHLRLAFGSADPDRWHRITLAEGDEVERCEDIALGDLDSDGQLDLVVAAEGGFVAVFFTDGNPREPTGWTQVTLTETLGRGSWIRVELGDLTGDGQLEIVATNKVGRGAQGTFSVFQHRSDSRDPGAWTETVVGRGESPIHARPIDMDGDGDLDIVAGSWGDLTIWVFENRDQGRTYVAHEVVRGGSPSITGFMLEAGDINGDGRLDLISGTGPRHDGIDAIHWFAQPDNLDGDWISYPLGSLEPDKTVSVLLVNLDRDDALELVVGSYSWEPWEALPPDPDPSDASGRIAWFDPGTDPRAPWTRHEVVRRRSGMYDEWVAADVNHDGRMDLVSTRGNSGHFDGVIWLERTRASTTFRPARTEDIELN